MPVQQFNLHATQFLNTFFFFFKQLSYCIWYKISTPYFDIKTCTGWVLLTSHPPHCLHWVELTSPFRATESILAQFSSLFLGAETFSPPQAFHTYWPPACHLTTLPSSLPCSQLIRPSFSASRFFLWEVSLLHKAHYYNSYQIFFCCCFVFSRYLSKLLRYCFSWDFLDICLSCHHIFFFSPHKAYNYSLFLTSAGLTCFWALYRHGFLSHYIQWLAQCLAHCQCSINISWVNDQDQFLGNSGKKAE